jgi:DNA uptake protein ComE-like DNA-binding protein
MEPIYRQGASGSVLKAEKHPGPNDFATVNKLLLRNPRNKKVRFMPRFPLTHLSAAATIIALAACSGDAPRDEAAAPAETAAIEATTATAAPTVLDANAATEAQLSGIAGVTPEIARQIVAGRPYADATAFAAALRKTTSDTEASDLMTRIFVPVNLNTASEEAIKLIPGMTPKMVHEFMEYRPYADMAEFDREIGKYVDEAEVARLRSYTTL